MKVRRRRRADSRRFRQMPMFPAETRQLGFRTPADGGDSARRRWNLAIVPAFNEAGAIASTVAAIHDAAPDFDVLVIDDGSSDATAELAARAGAAVLRMPFNVGIGAAMQGGYIFACEHGYELAVQVDGDGQHDPRHIADLAARLRADARLDMVTGSRFLDENLDGYRSSACRRLGIRLFSRVVSLIPGPP